MKQIIKMPNKIGNVSDVAPLSPLAQPLSPIAQPNTDTTENIGYPAHTLKQRAIQKQTTLLIVNKQF